MRKKTAVLAAVLAGSLLCTACGDTPQAVQRRDTETETEMGTALERENGTEKEKTAGAGNGGTEEGGGENTQDGIRTDVIGGADGPTAIFIARKQDGEEETQEYASLNQSAGEIKIDPEQTEKVYLDAVLDSGDGELEAVIHGPFGAAFLQREEASSPFWRAVVSADMKAVCASYMEGTDSTEVLAGGRSIFIFQKEDGQITNEYELQADNRSLYRDEPEEGGAEQAEWFASTLREINRLSGQSARKESEERAENLPEGGEKQRGQSEKQPENPAEVRFPEIKADRGKALKVYDCFTKTDGTKVYLCSDGDTLADLYLVLEPEDGEAAEQKAERIVWESGN